MNFCSFKSSIEQCFILNVACWLMDENLSLEFSCTWILVTTKT